MKCQKESVPTVNLLKLCDAPTGLRFKNFTFCHTVYVCFVFISEQIETFALYIAN